MPRWPKDPILPPFKPWDELGRRWHPPAAAQEQGSGFTWQQDARDNQSHSTGESLQCRGVLYFIPEERELEEHQNKELQKGAVLAQGILLYELSRFRAMEKITH